MRRQKPVCVRTYSSCVACSGLSCSKYSTRARSPGSQSSYSSGQLVATIGLQNVIVINTEDVTLVCPMDCAQDVRQMVKKLREEGKQDYT